MQEPRDSKSFIEVLEAEIRADLRKEIEAEVLARLGGAAHASTGRPSTLESRETQAAGRFETWLAANVGPITFNRKQTAQARYTGQPRAKTAEPRTTATPAPTAQPAAPTRFHATTAADLFAIEILNRQSPTALGASFTEDELKAVWRKAALKTHPDRFVGSDAITQTRMTVLFRELAEAYETLLALVETSSATAA